MKKIFSKLFKFDEVEGFQVKLTPVFIYALVLGTVIFSALYLIAGVQTWVFVLAAIYILIVFYAAFLAGKYVKSSLPQETTVIKRYSLANAHVQYGKYKEAIEEYFNELREDPQDPTPWYYIAEVYHRYMKDYEMALRAYEMAATQRANSKLAAASLDQMGSIYMELKDMDKARIVYERLLTEHPTSRLAERAMKLLETLKNRPFLQF